MFIYVFSLKFWPCPNIFSVSSVQELDFTAEIELDPSICRLPASDQRVSFVLSVFGQSNSRLTVELGTVFFYLLFLANTLSQYSRS